MILRPVSKRVFRRQLGRHRRYATEGTKTIFICKETFENELMQDLYAQAKEKISCSKHNGWVECISKTPLDSPWAYQALPEVEMFSLKTTDSPIKLGQLAASYVASKLQGGGLFDIHSIPTPGTSFQSNIKQVEGALMEMLKRKYKQVAKLKNNREGKILSPGQQLVQIMLKDANKLAVSISTLSASAAGWSRPLPFPVGHMYIHNHKRYPAESFMKMKEMMALMRIDARGELKDKLCIELGAAPGGWTMVMLENEARVYSVDWADMPDSYFQRNPMHFHYRGDARIIDPMDLASATKDHSLPLTYPVDFLFADLATPPLISAAILEGWISGKRMRRFGWAIKLGFHDERKNYHEVTQPIREMLEKYKVTYVLRHLYRQGNEFMILGALPE